MVRFFWMAVIFLVAACASSPAEERLWVDKLIHSESSEQEAIHAKAFSRNVWSYGVTIRKSGASDDLAIDDLPNHLDDKLIVTILHRYGKFQWEPKNNENIFTVLKR